jgi:hypothetical protein
VDAVAAGLAGLGREHRGLWTRQEALAVTARGRVDGFVRRNEWRAVWPGVLTDGGTELDHEQRAQAAVLACGRGAVATGRTAARVHRLPLIDDLDPSTGARQHLVDDVATGGARRSLRMPGPDGEVRVLRRSALVLLPEDVVRSDSGVRLTSPLQTLVDLASLLSYEALACAVDHALHVHLVTEGQLATAVRERTWCPGVVHLRAAVAIADRRAESPAETLARLALLPELPALVPQHRLLDRHGRVLARYDLADEELRLAVEADGKAGHAAPEMAAKDRLRDRLSEHYGWRTERVTWWELRRRRTAFVRRIAEVAGDRRRLLQPP